jgi:hypothetical protein
MSSGVAPFFSLYFSHALFSDTKLLLLF